MPQVPTYNGPLVQQNALPVPHLTTPDVSSGSQSLSQSLAGIAAETGKAVMADAQDESFRVQAQVRSDWQQQRAALREQHQGDNAVDYAPAAKKWWDEAQKKYLANVSPLARSLAAEGLTSTQLHAEDDTLEYVSREKARMSGVHFNSSIDTSVTSYASQLTPANAAQMGAQAEADIRKQAITHGASLGLTSDDAIAGVRPFIERFHAAAALLLVDKDPHAAKDYVTKFGSSMDFGQRAHAEEAVHHALVNEEGSNLANSWAAKRFGIGSVMSAAQSIKDPDVRKIAVDTARLNLSMQESERNQNKSLAGDRVWAAMAAGHRPSASDIATNPEAWYSSQAAQLSLARSRAEGVSIKTDPGTWAELLDSARADPGNFSKTNLAQYVGKLSPSDMHIIAGMQAESRKPDNTIATTQEQINSYVKPMSKSNAAEFTRQVYSEIARQQTANGGKSMDLEGRRKIMDNLTHDVGSAWYTFGMGNSQEFNRIPESERVDAENYLRAHKKAVTPESTYTVWKSKQ